MLLNNHWFQFTSPSVILAELCYMIKCYFLSGWFVGRSGHLDNTKQIFCAPIFNVPGMAEPWKTIQVHAVFGSNLRLQNAHIRKWTSLEKVTLADLLCGISRIEFYVAFIWHLILSYPKATTSSKFSNVKSIPVKIDTDI